MNRMNLLPEDLRPQNGHRVRESPAFRLLLAAALLLAVGYAYLTVEIPRLEDRIEAGCARIDALTLAPGGMEEMSGVAVPGAQRRLIRDVVDRLDECVPPDVTLIGLKVAADTDVLSSEKAMPASPPERVEITGVSGSGRAIGDLLVALERSGLYATVELSNLDRREDGEFAFTIQGRLSP